MQKYRMGMGYEWDILIYYKDRWIDGWVHVLIDRWTDR
jgi:hypothetical protein